MYPPAVYPDHNIEPENQASESAAASSRAKYAQLGSMIAVVAFGIIGLTSFTFLSADDSGANKEAESAALSESAYIEADTDAAGGKFVRLGVLNIASPSPTPQQPTPTPGGSATPIATPDQNSGDWFGYIKPGPSNTGPTTDSLESIGGVTITDTWLNSQNGGSRVVEGKSFTGQVTIEANDVTLRNFVITSGSAYGIRATNGNTGIVIEDGEIKGMSSAGLYGGGFVAKRLNIHDSGVDAVKSTSDMALESSWFHHLGTTPGAHADGVQMVAGNNNVFRGNYCDMPFPAPAGYLANTCFIIQTNNAPIDNIAIEYNWLNGGNITIQIRDKGAGYGAPTNVGIKNNRFGRDYQFDLFKLDGTVALEGNVWDDTSEAVE